MSETPNSDDQAARSRFDKEEILVLRDADGLYYVVPTKHMPRNLVREDQVGEVERVIESQRGDRETIAIVGVFDLTRTQRRKWVPPVIENLGIPGAVPTS